MAEDGPPTKRTKTSYPHSTTPTDDPRTGQLVCEDDGKAIFGPSELAVGVVSFPYDEGCARNGGRPGAEAGPEVFLKTFPKIGTVLNPEYGVDLNSIRVLLCDGVPKGMGLEEAHERLHARVVACLHRGLAPFVIGGSNDQSYPNARALLDICKASGRSVGVVNIDAHLDVRPQKQGLEHSGSPFRLLLEDPDFAVCNGSFVEFAAQGAQCSAAHASFVTEKGGRIMWGNVVEAFREMLSTLGQEVFVSFDLDSVRASDAPGVSCPGSIGLSAEEAFGMCFEAGRCEQVRLFDLSEFNPRVESYLTARLVSGMFYHYLLGLASRRAQG